MRAILLGVQGFWAEMFVHDLPVTIELPCLASYKMDIEDMAGPPAGGTIPLRHLRFVRIAVSRDILDQTETSTAVYMQVIDREGR